MYYKLYYICLTNGTWAMKKHPVYQVRVRKEMLEWLRAKGPEVIRGFWEEMMVRDGCIGEVKMDEPSGSGPFTEVVPVWKVKLEAQLAERGVGEEASSFSGSAAPDASASVSAPREDGENMGIADPSTQVKSIPAVRSRVFSRTEEEKMEKMKRLQEMRLMPQMSKKPDFYPDEEPNEEP